MFSSIGTMGPVEHWRPHENINDSIVNNNDKFVVNNG